MTEDFFLYQKSYGNTNRFKFFNTHFFFSYRSGHFWPYRSKKKSVRSKTFLYDSLETREFLWIKTPMGIQWFEIQFLAIFSITRESIEIRSKLAINQIASSLIISNHSDWSKSPMGTVFFTCRPPSFWLAAAVVVSESKSCFYEAENRTASRHWVSANRYARFLCASKLLSV